MVTPAMIALSGIAFSYGGQAPVLRDIDWQVAAGESWAVIGPSGCGKTTLLYLLAGLHAPDAGVIRIAGRPLERPRPSTGLVLQDHGLMPWATVRANARLGLRIRRFYGPDGRHAPSGTALDPPTAEALLDHWIRRLGLTELQDKYPAQLSRGQRQRTAICRTLALEPDLLLLDEPFSALDAPTREDLERLVATLRRERRLTVVLVTHDIQVAVAMGERILVLGGAGGGQVVDNACTLDAEGQPPPGSRAMCELLRERLGGLMA